MVTHADFASYKPIKLGVAVQPPALIIKYVDANSAHPKHHQVRLEKFRAKLELEGIREYILKKHGPYFPEDKVSASTLNRLIEKFIKKCQQAAEPPKTNRFEKKPAPIEADARTRVNVRETTPDVGRKNSRSLVKPHSPIEESIGDFEEEDELRSEDLGLGRKGMSHSKLSQEGLPSIFKNPSLSRSKISGLGDSLKDKEKKANVIVTPTPREQAKPAKDKVFFDSQKKPEPIISPKPVTPTPKDDFDEDFDDFEDLRFEDSKKSSVRKSNQNLGKDKPAPKPSPQDDDFGDFDDFDDIKSDLSKSKSKPSVKPKKPDDDDGFDDIPDEDEEVLARSQPSRGKNGQDQKQSRFSELNFDYRTLDLNKLNDEEVEFVKKTMDKEFKQLKPGDSGFKYEKSASFQQEESNDWDD